MAQTRSRRCVPCNFDWPHMDDCRTCPVCHATTFEHDAKPDCTITQAREAIRTHASVAQAPTEELPAVDPVYAHRVERYAALGFTDAEAMLLASALDDKGFPVYHGRVSELIAAGMTRAQAIQVFA